VSIASLSPTSLRNFDHLADEPGVEFAGGQLIEKPMSIQSSEVGAQVLGLLILDAMKSGRAKVYDSSLGYRVYPEDPNKFRKPDISVICVDRLAGIDRADGFMRIPADLVVEVLSPGDLAYDVTEKVDEYLEHGFRTVWVVHPNTRSVAIYRRDGSVTLLHEGDTITCEDVVPGFHRTVAEFFDPPAPQP
jgi:Uma2 family endonuclease